MEEYIKYKNNNYVCILCKFKTRLKEIINDHKCLYIPKLLSLNKINKLIHISDIHIRKNSRFEEYNHVFNNLYNSLKDFKINNNKSLIVITGDILHNKDELSPESIMLTWDFFKNLSNIFPLIIIPGNHDSIIHNSDKIDSISAVLKDRPLENIHYLKNSDYYKYGNIIFGVSSILDNHFMSAKDIKYYNLIKIGLYHGIVGDVYINDTSQISGTIKLSSFNGYDYVLLGDIHKYQYLNKDKTIGYASSLISQNFSEIDNYHGWLEWDLETKESKYHIINNEYAHQQYKYINKKIIIDNISYDTIIDCISLIPIKGNIKILYENELDVMELIKELKILLPEIKICKQEIININNNSSNQKVIINNFNNEINLELLIEEYMNIKYPEIDKVEIKNEIINKLDNIRELKRQDMSNMNWDLVQLKFDNMYGYGKDNIIDFDEYENNKVIGIFANNSYGKSSLIDIITFMIYSSSARESSNVIPKDIINIHSKTANGELLFRIGNTYYLIIKKCYRNNNNIKLETSKLYKLEEDNNNILYNYRNKNYNLIDVTCNDRRKTDSLIESLVGTKEDFIFTCLSLQKNNWSFKDMTQKMRKEFLSSVLKLDFFKTIHKDFDVNTKVLKKELELLLNKINKQPLITHIEENIEELKYKIVNLKENETILEKDINEINNNLLVISKKYKNINIKNINIEKLDYEIKDYEKMITIIKDEINNLHLINQSETIINNYNIFTKKKNEKIILLREELVLLKNKLIEIDNINEKDLINRFNQLNNLSFDDHELYEKLINAKEIIIDIFNDYEKLLEISKNNSYNAIINFIEKSNIIKYNKCLNNVNNRLKLELDNCKSILDKINNNRIINEKINKIIEQINILNQEDYDLYNKLLEEQKIFNIKSKELNEYTEKIRIMKLDFELYNQYKLDIEYNKELDKEINIFKELLNSKQLELKNTRRDLEYNNICLTKLISDIEIYKSNVDTYNKKDNDYKKNKIITEIVSRDGLQLYILQKYIPDIENKVNNILSEMIDKRIKLYLDNDDIILEIYKDNNCINTSGGMEAFIIDLAFKIVITRIAYLPKPNIFFIDEGISVLDSDHIANINTLLNFLRIYYSHIFLISHISSVKDFVDYNLQITKNIINYNSKVFNKNKV